ncbi:MAG: MFS transporter [Bacteroidota bacterium]
MSFFKAESIGVLNIKDFRHFILARFFLTLAIQMQFSTIYLQIYYEYSKQEIILGLIGLTEAVPYILISFYSGHYADKHRKKDILLTAVFLLFTGALFLFLNAHNAVQLMRELGLTVLFVIVFIFGCIRSFLGASTNPFISQLVPRHSYTHSATWNSTAWHVACILGPIIAALIYGFQNHYNGAWCHFTEMLFFALSFYFFLKINNKGLPEKNAQEEGVLASIKTGLHFVFKNKMVLSALSLDLFAVLFGGAVVLIPAFTDKVLHLGPQAYGFLRTAPAIGAVAMATVMVIYPPSKKAGKALLWSVFAFGVFTILFGLSKTYWMAFLMLFFTGAFDNVSVIVRHSILQLQTPNAMRGRVSAINSIFIGSSNEIGAFESGFAAKIFGLVPSIIFGGGMTILVVLGIHKINPKLKDLDISKI